MSTLPNTPREWARRRRNRRMTPLVWILAAVDVAVVIFVAYGIARLK